MLKQVGEAIAKPLCMIFNSSLQTGQLPWQWKCSTICPIFKKGSKSNPLNYRPVALTSSICRLKETIIKDNMLVHLSSNRLISSEQHGFLPKRSTTTQLLSCLKDWMDNFDQSIDTNVVYTDFSKAFDKVSHEKLVQILSSYGIKGSILTWIKNFLVNRQQMVHINTSSSRKVQITSGVPQGSVMGPLLFLLYIDDIKDLSTTGCQAYLFADDYKVYSTDKHALQQTLNNVSSFTKSRQLTLALPKCNHLLITNGNEHTNLKLDNDTLSPVWNVRDLGVQIKHNLKWDLHITNIKNKAVQRSYQIFRAFTTKNIWTLLKCYNVYIRPLLEFNTIIWNPRMIKYMNAKN